MKLISWWEETKWGHGNKYCVWCHKMQICVFFMKKRQKKPVHFCTMCLWKVWQFFVHYNGYLLFKNRSTSHVHLCYETGCPTSFSIQVIMGIFMILFVFFSGRKDLGSNWCQTQILWPKCKQTSNLPDISSTLIWCHYAN